MQCRDFGKFTLLNHMGKGGVASVYRAHDNEAGNIVAVKIFERTEKRTTNTVRRLRDREVQMLISIQHPNVVKYYESGSVGESYYYTMEFVENSLLKRMHRSDGLALEDKIHILRQTCNALQAIHHQGIVHRDIKPGNILLDEAPSGAIHVKVTDLGIAKHVSETDAPRDNSSNKVPGTPKYLSPEQIRMKPVDGRADIFSLGVVAYEMLSGGPPFEADSSEEYLRANLEQDIEPVHHVNEDVPAFLNPMLERMLAKDREERYDSDTLARDLELTYQHLVSNAALVERRNPESVYYVPPAPEREEQPEKTTSRLWALAVVGILLLVGGAIGYLKWPEAPAPPESGEPIQLGQWRSPVPQEALARAEEMTNEGKYWGAIALVQGLDREQMNQAQLNTADELIQTAHVALAENALQQGLEAVQAGELTRAEILVEKIRGVYSQSQRADELAGRIQQVRAQVERQKQWRNQLNALRGLYEDGEWPQALERAQQLIKSWDDPDKKSTLRKIYIGAVNEWQKAVLQGGLDRDKAETCLEAVSNAMQKPWARSGIEDRRAALEFSIAMAYARDRAIEDAMRQANMVLEKYPGTRAAEEARELRQRIIQTGALSPLDLDPFSRELEKGGFRSTVWYDRSSEFGEQKTMDGVLVLTIKGGEKQRENVRSTVRPVRPNVGFDLSVEFRVKAMDVAERSRYAAGIRIKDRMDNDISVLFDGASYDLARTFGNVSGGQELQAATGDESDEWHQLGMRYQYDLSKLEVLIDGETVGEYEVDLGVFQIDVFARISGEGECRAAFRKIQCSRP